MERSGYRRLFEDQIVVVANHDESETLRLICASDPRGVLVLSRRAAEAPYRQSDGTYRAPYSSSAAVGKSNAEVAVLGGRAGLALRKRRFFRSFRKIAIASLGGLICALPGLARYGLRGDLKYAGLLRRPDAPSFSLPLIVFENNRFGLEGSQRLFAPPDMTPRDVLGLIAHTNYVLLRWPEQVEGGKAMPDLDILVADADLESVKQALAQRLGIFPVDAYTESGSSHHSFKSAPYYPPRVARRMVAQATLRPSGIKSLAGDLAYLSYAYHLLFHKTHLVAAGVEELGATTWPTPDPVAELTRLAEAAGRQVPRTFAELESHLARADMMPPLDTIGFYSQGNKFLSARYCQTKFRPGLSVFLIRDFGIDPSPVAEVRGRLLERGFAIAAEGEIDLRCHKGAIEQIRGGNWYDKYAAGRLALPRYYLVCRNPNPRKPSRRTLARYPRVDDECILVKTLIREEFTRRRGSPTNFIHASDNTAEACEYMRALGLDDEMVAHGFSGAA